MVTIYYTKIYDYVKCFRVIIDTVKTIRKTENCKEGSRR